jgi:hypothetical protein
MGIQVVAEGLIAPMIMILPRWTPPSPMRHNWASKEVHLGSGLQSFQMRGRDNYQHMEGFAANTKGPDCEKGIHKFPDALCKCSNRYRVVFRSDVTNTNLTRKSFIP